MTSEHAWLSRLPLQIGDEVVPLLVGIGDDAAVLAPSDLPLLVTVDAAVEDVHFRRAFASFETIGYRSFMAAASDVAAMGGTIRAAVSAITVPRGKDTEILDALMSGQREAANQLHTVIVGGNVSAGAVISITTTVFGSVTTPIRRSGVLPGQKLFLHGPVGHAAVGLLALQQGAMDVSADVVFCITAWRRPRARIAEGIAVLGRVSAAIDVSDGLAQDAGHLACASHVRLVLDEAAVMAAAGPKFARAAAELGGNAVSLALAGGEDYALLVSSCDDLASLGWVPIGYAEAGPAEVIVVRDNQRYYPPAGFDHMGL